MKRYVSSIIIGTFISCTLPLSGQTAKRVISLSELFALADTQSKTIKVYEAAVEVADRNIKSAKTAFLPDIMLTASATYNGDAWVADRNFSNGQTFPAPHFGNNFALEASQTVFAGGAIHFNIEALELQKRINQWNLTAHKQDTYFLLAGYYLDLYKYHNLLTVYDRNIEQTQQVIKDMKAREAAGIVLPNDITRYEVQLQNLNYGRTELLSSIRISNDRLVTILNLPEQTEIYPDTTLLSRQWSSPPENDLHATAFEKSPELNMKRLTLDMLDKRIKVTKAGYMPKISIIAGDNLKGPITYEIPTLNNNINTWYVGIGLKFNIGNLYRTPRDLSTLRTTVMQKQVELSEAQERVTMDVNAAYIRYLDSFELLRTQQKSLQLADENYTVVANRYNNDLVLITDLVDADNLRLSAQVQYVNAQINVIYNYYKLLYATGTIAPANNYE